MSRKRTAEEFRNFYGAQLLKAGRNASHTFTDLKRAFGKYYPFVSIVPGYYGLSTNIEPPEPHDPAEPDILIRDVDGEMIAGIEVTGSDKVHVPPKNAWIGAHKMEYALTCGYPVGFVLYYPNARYFVPADLVAACASEPREKRIGGFLEYYHVLNYDVLKPYEILKVWVLAKIKERMTA